MIGRLEEELQRAPIDGGALRASRVTAVRQETVQALERGLVQRPGRVVQAKLGAFARVDVHHAQG